MKYIQRKRKQRGAALIVAMVLLLLLTLLGTDGIQHSMLDMYLSKGFRDQNHAFQSAETGLRLAEEILESSTTQDAATTSLTANNIFVESGFVDYHSSDYWNDKPSYGSEYPVKVVVQYWRFIADSLAVGNGNPSGLTYYRITARGSDPAYERYLNDGNNEDYKKNRSLAVLQSIYAVRHTN
ncbi:PilX N-terminal domain-containing pilus assembly protein [Sansalvadorimonas sp. 2012CJ34-2]|uniref:PilX N-terminal domain-containing pilus assembly protein n=1 Tax=Parendozoicomonas callyspongiae TaxID=2942213 RepID=A0ABT0PEM6_9GAMM|nr:PilX N-terminal domain-containing pilus assembly protein [Sansalvadorimonas sp. 2012CJ34-2]MCL6269486.1 PilX N-terminal domain-containing pilus assembly protein [Sansalvadorimonas sp. 2012CJ34-2]